MTIKLHSRIAAAAVIAPLAVLAVGCGSDSGDNSDDAASDTQTTASSDPTAPASDATTTPTTSEPSEPPPAAPAGVDYVVDGAWHQADGDVVELPKNPNPYDAAVIWNDQLVATYWDGEVYSVTDVIDDDGNVVDSFDTASSPAVNEAGTTIAWIDTDGTVMTAWGSGKDEQVSMGSRRPRRPWRDRRLLHRRGHRRPELLRGRGRLHRLRELRPRRRVAFLRLARHQRHRRAGHHRRSSTRPTTAWSA